MKYTVTKLGETIAEFKEGASYLLLVNPANVRMKNLMKSLESIPSNIQVVLCNNPTEDVKVVGIEKTK